MPTYQPLDAARIRDGLDTLVVGREVTCFEVCDSTNLRAWAAASGGAPDGAAFLADTQTAGRGRQGRTWLDEPGDCLLLSVLFRPIGLLATEAHLFTMLAATATLTAVEAAALLAVELKWPNDLVVGERKLAGILVETSLLGDAVEAAVVGVGLNVTLDAASHSSIAATATSIAREVGHPVERLPLARELLRQLDRRYVALRAGDRAGIFAEWRARLGTLGRRVEVVGALPGAAEATSVVLVEDVAPDGALLGRLEDGTRVAYHFAEVSLRGVSGQRIRPTD